MKLCSTLRVRNRLGRISRVCLGFAATMVTGRGSAAEGLDLMAGWARVDITPDMKSGKKPVLAGLMIPRFTDTVDHPVMVTALALDGRRGGNVVEQALFISCDIGVGTHNQWMGGSLLDELRLRIKGRLPGLDENKIMTMCTHTHNSPSFMEGQYKLPAEDWVLQPAEYRKFLLTRLEEVVEKAWRGREPTAMTWALGHAVVGYNRRVIYADGQAVLGGWRRDPAFEFIEGGSDYGLKTLFFWNPRGELKGVLVNVACPSQVQIQESVISADFWGDVREQLRRQPGFENAFILPMLAAAGDQWPYQQIRDKAEAAMRERRGLDLTGELGRRIVREVVDLLPLSRREPRARVDFRHVVRTLPMPLRVITAEEAKRINEEYAKHEVTPSAMQHQWLARLGLLKERYQRQQREPVSAPVELHFLRLDDVAIATNPFELYVDYAVQMESRSPAILTLTSQLTAELGTGLAYLPTERAIPHRGYSADIVYNNCLVGPEGGRLLVTETVRELAQLWGKP